ncbi:MAG TPA: threonine/serine exporter family protein [Streptosporangiaceae bacterium]|nr:threonine/serine exporter family protein [Streptosporangiaceae bacterium]
MTAGGPDSSFDPDVDGLLSGLTRFLLLHSAEGAFELRDTVQSVGRAYGVQAEILAVAEGAVLTVRHPDGASYHDTVRVGPELTRLDLVSRAKFLVNRVLRGGISAAAARRELASMESSRDPYPWWLRLFGVALFAVGFAPGVQQTWREVAAAAILGAVMGVMFVAAEWAGGLRVLLPIVGTLVVAAIAFEVLHAQSAPGGPVLLIIPGLFILIPGDLLCAATAEIAVGQFTPGAVRLAQAAVTLLQLAAGVMIAAELTGVGVKALSQPTPPGHSLPGWLAVVAWIPFTVGLAWTFNARMRDVPWMLLLVYLAWGVQQLVLAHSLVVPQEGETGATAAVFVAATVLAFAAGVLDQFGSLPPRGVTILGGFFALTVGAVALRGLTSLAGAPRIEGFDDIRDATSETVALTLGLITGAVPAAALGVYRRRGRRATAADRVGGDSAR